MLPIPHPQVNSSPNFSITSLTTSFPLFHVPINLYFPQKREKQRNQHVLQNDNMIRM